MGWVDAYAKIMKDYGLRVQKSVFEVDVTHKEFSHLRKRTEKELDPKEDGVKYFPLCRRCSGVWLHIGQGKVEWNEGNFLVL